MRSISKTDQTRTNLLDAVERLSARGPMSGITMRAIADEAGSSLGLAYRYFDTKEDLLGAVLDRAANHITANMVSTDSAGQAARQAWKRMAERPVFGRLFTSMILEGRDVTEIMSGHPFLQVLGRQAESAGDRDPMSAAAAVGIITIGGGVFGPAINQAAGKQPGDEAVYARLEHAVESISAATPRQTDTVGGRQ